ncbi:hypothetical protein PAPYR_9865 [Paratrimastix pyriformis]|uniref:Uncharacterized protein n=1 Tax=Paratrimastix pyriformis TaxID=342808 RepID=A0ABQ8UCU8_9EUKA|nr:hypothetical protein PAPYR_9865 [Paratrimastix pyriformis]
MSQSLILTGIQETAKRNLVKYLKYVGYEQLPTRPVSGARAVEALLASGITWDWSQVTREDGDVLMKLSSQRAIEETLSSSAHLRTFSHFPPPLNREAPHVATPILPIAEQVPMPAPILPIAEPEPEPLPEPEPVPEPEPLPEPEPVPEPLPAPEFPIFAEEVPDPQMPMIAQPVQAPPAPQHDLAAIYDAIRRSEETIRNDISALRLEMIRMIGEVMAKVQAPPMVLGEPEDLDEDGEEEEEDEDEPEEKKSPKLRG